MRVDGIKFRGMGRFREQVEVDLRALPGPLVAVTGDNGSGKSTLLELILGATHRKTPTRGTLGELANARDSFVEVVIEAGFGPVAIRQTVDGRTGKGECSVTNAAGPVLTSGNRREYDAWAKENLPSLDVLLSSMFGAQGQGGFLDLDPGDRKGVLLRVLGHEHLEHLAEKARRRATHAGGEAAAARRRADEAAAALRSAEAAAQDAEAIAEALAKLDAGEAQLRAELEGLREQHRVYAADLERHRADAAARAGARDRAAKLTARRLDLTERLKNNRELVADAADIRAAAARVTDLEFTIQALSTDLERVHKERGEAAERRDAQRAKRSALVAEARTLDHQAQADAAGAETARRAGETAQASLDAAVAALMDAEPEVEVAREAWRVANLAAMTASADKRIDDLYRAHRWIVAECPTLEAAQRASRTAMDEDEVTAKLVANPPKKLPEKDRLTAAQKKVAELQEQRRKAEADVAAARGVPATLERVKAARAKVTQLQELAAAKDASMSEDEAKVAKLDKEAAGLRARRDELKADHAKDAHRARAVAQLDAAEARIVELEASLAAVEGDIDAAAAELAATPAVPAPPAPPAMAPVSTSLEVLSHQRKEQSAKLAAARAAAERLVTARAAAAGADGALASAEAHVADWNLLAEGLGRNGIQALGIDAAGPELTTLTNDLLGACFGPRFVVTLDTTRRAADGKSDIEGCYVTVLDTAEGGREGEARSYSGGERVLIGEAVNLAISTMVARGAGVRGVTLVRDETGAALSPEKGRAYVAMLRRAADLIGADRVLFVSHVPEMGELADSRLVLDNGRVEIR